MSALPITITTAGLEALINAQNTGVSNVVIDKLGVSSQHVVITSATTVIPAEIKRLSGVSGLVTADDTIYISAADQSQDTYTVRTVAFYLTDGTLFAAYSQPDPMVEKAAPSQAVLEASIKLLAPMAEVIEFTGGGWVNPPASETVSGVLRLASVDDALAGVNHSKAITPKGLKAVTNAMMAAISASLDALNNALGGKANTNHSHNAGDVNAGTFNEARIPDLPQSRITGLIAALGDKANALHSHSMAQINGLVDALAAKAASVHAHHADDINAGVLAVGRIPALAMDKITGLAVALANKADAALSLVMRGSLGSVNSPNNTLVPGAYRQATNANAQIADGYPINNDGGTLLVYNPSTDTGLQTYHGRSSGRFWSRPFLAGSFSPWVEHWTTGNFNPADKANVYAPVFGGLITSPNVAIKNAASTWRSLKFFSGESERWGLMMNTDPENEATNAGGNLFLTAGMADGSTRNVMSFDRASQKVRFYQTPHVNGYDVHHKGDLRQASNAEIVAGNLGAERYITPAGLWSFAKSIGPSGYVQIPGTDLIIQWGVITSSMTEGLQHAMLPVAFGGGCLVALANARNPSAVIQYDWYMQVQSKWLDRITFYANKANDSSPAMQGFEWMAIGLAKGNPNPVYSGGTGGGGGGEFPPGGGGGENQPVIP